ncbi:uncharacterized protein MELLADRAFT_69240 [Melampsora larici-populina 98AG31]|uniref:Uncharacterized protein n=1 Tax=Melampsora larici-populina (strain 98AG31 / pathotype 3-4-7) TaxID=747676 RepID=F4S9X2_MELLP|nr:uncharacterized protein MELLADRAFT_69240 [Melampsora larici-populina 98AG31]EGF98557.1 hypothetical protein MELLADRAFT_69240 [Melampsora larici-populina 98AG31]
MSEISNIDATTRFDEMDLDSDLTDLSDIEQTVLPSLLTASIPVAPLVPNANHPAKPPGRRPLKKKGGSKTQTKPKPRSHFIPPHLIPDVAAHEFPSVYRRRAQVAEYLHRIFKKATIIPVDFDLAVAYFLQQTDHLKLGDIRASVEKITADYSILDPLTGRQESLRHCTQYINQVIADYDAHPNLPLPFALRYPNLAALNQLAIDRTKDPQIVASTLSGTERGRLALAGAAIVNDTPVFAGPMTLATSLRTTHDPTATPPVFSSPFEVSSTASSRLSGAKSVYNEVPGVTTGVLSSQVVGYGRYSDFSTGMSDTQMALGRARQGHPESDWASKEVSQFNLAAMIQMGKEHSFQRDAEDRIESELIWHNEQARLIIKAFQPNSYTAATNSLQVLINSGTPGVSKSIRGLINPIGLGKYLVQWHVMFNMQVDHHRDGHNATLFASANFFGQHYAGGELILNYLGYAVCGAPGYSVHGAFDILMHGVSKITCLPNKNNEPAQRICMAIYSHADVFAGAARFSGMNQSPKVFSDSRLWIPFYPGGFALASCIQSFFDEQKRLYAKYLAERRARWQSGALAASSCASTSTSL